MITQENGFALVLSGREPECELGHLLVSAGYRLRWVTSVLEFPNVAQSVSPDVILFDLPGSDFNPEVLRDLKKDSLTSQVTVLSVLAEGTLEDRANAIQAGADDYLVHPFERDEVLIRLRNAVIRTRQARDLKRDAETIRQLEEARAELTQLIIKDMKMPLTGLADLLQISGGGGSAKPFKQDASRVVNEALGATEALEEMIELLMSVKKLMANEAILNKEPCEILKLARSISGVLSESIQASGLTVDVDGDAAMVSCDQAQMSRVIRHLVRLAIKAEPLEHRIRIRVKRMSGRVKLSVGADGGFCHPSLETDGLGLTYCRLVLAAHGGSFGVPLPSESSSPWWVELPVAVDLNLSALPANNETVAFLGRSRRYLGVLTSGLPNRKTHSLFSLGTRQQFMVAVALMSVIPLLAFAYILGDALMTRSFNMETLYFLLPSIVALMALGVMLLARHIIEVNRLRQYLEEIARGEIPSISKDNSSEDFAAIQKSLGMVIQKSSEKVKVLEEQSKVRLHAEQNRVMTETVGAACHHLGQPATIIRGYLDLMKRAEVSPEMRAMIQECQAATEDVAIILSRLKGVGRYETEPYLQARSERIGNPDQRILKI